MNLPLSTALMIAALTVLRLLCIAIAALFLLLALRAQFDEAVRMPWSHAVLAALAFTTGAVACGWTRRLITQRAKGG